MQGGLVELLDEGGVIERTGARLPLGRAEQQLAEVACRGAVLEAIGPVLKAGRIRRAPEQTVVERVDLAACTRGCIFEVAEEVAGLLLH